MKKHYVINIISFLLLGWSSYSLGESKDDEARLSTTPINSSVAIGPNGIIYVGSTDGKLYALNPKNLSEIKWIFPRNGTVISIDSSPAIGPDGTIYFGADDHRFYALYPDGSCRWFHDDGLCGILTGGDIDSSPAIDSDGTVYFGSDDHSLYAIKADGTCKWSTCGFATNGSIDSSPALGPDGAIYFGSDDNRLYALNPDGSCRWFGDDGSCGILTGGDIDSSPAISQDGILYVGSDDKRFYAIDTDNGDVKWSYPTDDLISSSPAIAANGTVYIGSGDSILYSFAPDSNIPKWIFTEAGSGIRSSPVIDSYGTVYFGSEDGRLYAVTADNGCKWSQLSNRCGLPLGGSLTAPPTISPDGTIYIGSDEGYIYAIDPNGSCRWPDPNGSDSCGFKPGGQAGDIIQSKPAISDDGTIFVGSFDNKIYAITPDMECAWPDGNLCGFLTGGNITSSPALSEDRKTVYAGSNDGRLYAIDSTTGECVWPDGNLCGFLTGERIDSSPTVDRNNIIYVGSDDNKLYAIFPDGTKKWDTGNIIGGDIDSSPVVGPDGSIYVGADDNKLYAIFPDNGTKKWDTGGKISGLVTAAPTIGEDGSIYVGAADGNFYAFRPDDGSCKWTNCSFSTDGERINSTAAIGTDDTIYFGTLNNKLYALDTSTGIEKWNTENIVGGPINSSPTIGTDGTIYFGSDDYFFYAINPDGSLKWRYEGEGKMYSPTISDSDGVIYVGSSDNRVYSFFPDSYPGNWLSFRHDTRNTGLSFSYSPVISSESIPNNGNLLWTSHPIDKTWSQYAITNTSKPILGWMPHSNPSSVFRYQLNTIEGNSSWIETQSTSFTPSTNLANGGYLFSLEECLNPMINACPENSWSNASWLAIWIDRNAPHTTSNIDEVIGTHYFIELNCNDDIGSGCIETFYSIDGGRSYTPYVEPFSVPENISPDQIRYYSIDVAGNQESPLTLEGDFTVLELENYFPSTNLSPEAGLIITGRLTRLPPSTNVDLSNLSITLTIAPPGVTPDQCTQPTNDCTVSEVVTDFLGRFRFEFPQPSLFDRTGAYTLQARFDGTVLLSASNAEVSSVLVGASAGYAVIVQGRLGNDSFDLAAHNKTTNRIYDALRARGFADDNIYYFNYNTTQAGVDELPRKERIRWAIERWVVEQRNIAAVPAPFYLIMVDHGTPAIDGGAPASFHVDTDEVITSMELNDWLSTLESELQSVGVQNERVVILGACYSGGFIDELSANGRIIITSAAADEESYKGPEEIEADGTVIRSGEFFLEELFHKLREGETLTQAFAAATEETELFTRRDDNLLDPSSPYRDNAVQHPLLDDNGDGEGSNILVAGGDGTRARGLRLGVGVTPTTNASKQAYISQVTPPISLVGNEDAATLFAKVQNNWRSGTPWVEVRKPTLQLNPRGTSSIQLDNSLQRFPLQTDERSNTASAHWQETLKGVFTEPGRYDVIYFTRDSFTGAVSPVQRSVIYKRLSNTSPPEPFNLISPSSGLVTLPAIFNWEPTRDANDGPIEYYLSMARDVNFTQPVYRSPPLTCSAFVVPRDQSSVLLRPGESFYWVVEAHGTGGGPVFSNKFKITIGDDNSLDAIIQGLVYSRQSRLQPLSGANISSNLPIDPSSIIRSLGDGCYMVRLRQRGTALITATKGGYCEETSHSIEITGQGQIETVNLGLTFALQNSCQSAATNLPFLDNFESN